jgi:hypothetical protein
VVAAGIYARYSDERYDLAVVVLDDHDVVDYTHIRSAAGEQESTQLSELDVRTHEVLRPHHVEMAVLWPKDPPPGGHIKLKPTLAAGRGEGAALAAAGRLAIHSDVITGAGVRSVGGGTTDEAVGSLCAGVSGLPDDKAVRRAAAAALAWRQRRGKS